MNLGYAAQWPTLRLGLWNDAEGELLCPHGFPD
jgi:hypothetical protein